MTEEQERGAVNSKSLTRQMATGVIWMMLLKFAVRGLGLISTLILVRLLTPEDFGIVAMAMVFVAIMEVFSWFSFDVVLIHKKSATRDHYDTAWTFNLIFKSVSALVLVAGAYPASLYYGEPKVTLIMLALALGVLVSGFENIGIVNFRKHLQFDKEFRFMFLRKLSGFCITVPLAFILQDYRALVIGTVLSRFFSLALSYSMEPYRPRFSFAARAELFNFSIWLFLSNIFYAFRMRAAELVIGRLEGATQLGVFNVSYEISNFPTTELVAPINRAVFPGYAKMSGNMETLRKGYLDVIALIAMIAVPAGAGIAATAEILVPVALGENWLMATPLIATLGFYGVVAALQTNIGSIYLAIGRPQVITALHALHLAVLLTVSIPMTMRHGVNGAAWSYLGTALALLPLNYVVMFRTISLPIRPFASRLWRPVVSTALMYGVVSAVVQWLMLVANGDPNILHLLAAVCAGALVYTIGIAAFWLLWGRPDGAERYVLQAIQERLGKKGATTSE
jgi:O-antigen/teichoic acid export membrane protein